MAEVTVRIPEDKLKSGKRDFWLAVRPVKAPDTLWLQGTPIAEAESLNVVHIGPEGAEMDANFHVLLIECPEGTFRSEGPVAVVKTRELGVRTLKEITVHRTR